MVGMNIEARNTMPFFRNKVIDYNGNKGEEVDEENKARRGRIVKML
jgi:hypothetical protein